MIAFFRGDEIYIGWLGDSQAVLVREGKALRLVKPHKPEREVSKQKTNNNYYFFNVAFVEIL